MTDHTPHTAGDDGELREELAAIEHERWADWQKWCHKIIRQTIANGGSIEEVLARWDKQITTPYAALSESEQASDMEQVDRYWPLIEKYVQLHIANAVLEAEAQGEYNLITRIEKLTSKMDDEYGEFECLEDIENLLRERAPIVEAALHSQQEGKDHE